MNKKFILSTSLILLVGLAVFVSALSTDSQHNVKLNLNKGWNLVGMYAFDDSFSDLTNSGFIEVAYIYDNINKEYIQLYPNRDVGKIASSGILERWGTTAVWIYTKEAREFAPSSIDQPAQLSSIQLKQGWNFLSITPEMWNKAFNDFKGSCDIQKIYGYEQNNWAGLSLTFPINHEELIGSGLIVKVSSDCTLSSSTSGVNPPALP